MIRCRNAAEDRPRRYLLEPQDLMHALASMTAAGESDADGNPGEPLAIYHSHVRSPAHPSPTDAADAELWPYAFYVLVSLSEKPDLLAWRITGRVVSPVELRP